LRGQIKRAIIGAALSVFILPGLGHLYHRRLIRGLALITLTGVLLVVIAFSLFSALSRAVDELEGVMETGSLTDLAAQVRLGDQTFLVIVLGLMGGVWVFGAVDAFRTGLRTPAGQRQEGSDEISPA